MEEDRWASDKFAPPKCVLDPAKDHLVVHIVDRPIRFDARALVMPYGRVEYRQWVRRGPRLRSELAELFEEVRDCVSNVLIVCTSVENDISDEMNRAVHATSTTAMQMLNLKIIHEMSPERQDQVLAVDSIRNVVNVCPVPEADAPHGRVFTRWGTRFAYTGVTSPVQEAWWWKMHFRVPACSNGRTLQHKGTCWFNTALNVVLLSPVLSRVARSAALVHARTRGIATAGYEDMCPNMNNPPAIAELFFAVVHNLFFRARRLSRSHGDAITPMAGRAKHGDRNGPLPHLNHGVGGNPLTGLKTLIRAMSAHSLSVDLDDLTPASGVLGLTGGRRPPIVMAVFPEGGHRGSRTCARGLDGEPGYALDAALILLTHPARPKGEGHVVAGLICNGVPYVYDSNNIVAHTDWPNDDMRGYRAELEKDGSEFAGYDIAVGAAVYVDRDAIRSGKLGGLRALPPLGRRSRQGIMR